MLYWLSYEASTGAGRGNLGSESRLVFIWYRYVVRDLTGDEHEAYASLLQIVPERKYQDLTFSFCHNTIIGFPRPAGAFSIYQEIPEIPVVL